MDRNLFNHCMVCGKRNDETSHNIAGFHVHDNCQDSIVNLDNCAFSSATVITHKDRTIDDRWYTITDEHAPDHYTVTAYRSTQDYIDHKPCAIMNRAFYTSAVAYIVAEFEKR